jgi:hypothetical protein
VALAVMMKVLVLKKKVLAVSDNRFWDSPKKQTKSRRSSGSSSGKEAIQEVILGI